MNISKSIQPKPIFTEKQTYANKHYKVSFFTENPNKLPHIDQVQAVAFILKNKKLHVAMYKHINGSNGLPGGGTEEGETPKESLKRELIEEVNCKLIKSNWIGYELIKRLDKDQTNYFARYWALVEPLKGKINDPCGKSLKRIIVPYAKASKTLGWGKSGDFWLKQAKENFLKTYKLN